MRAVGESLQRVDAIKKVTGQAQYVDDIIMPRMLYAQVKRSPYPHARILRIDTSKAEACRRAQRHHRGLLHQALRALSGG